MTDPWDALDTLAAHLWARMARGAAEASHPFRFVALATCGSAGPEARMVGLRRADREAATVEVHSDLRTAKIAALRDDPRGALLFWDAATQEQLRLSVVFEILEGPADRWARVPPGARTNYGTDPAPGFAVASPRDVTRTPERARFAALPGRVLRMDAVSLAHDPHRRAVFEGPGRPGRWVAP
jgi:hypothetical protein